jgi:hypothetical protein
MLHTHRIMRNAHKILVGKPAGKEINNETLE